MYIEENNNMIIIVECQIISITPESLPSVLDMKTDVYINITTFSIICIRYVSCKQF